MCEEGIWFPRAYSVSGEYSMIKAGAAKGDYERAVTMGEVCGDARAGADSLILRAADDARGCERE